MCTFVGIEGALNNTSHTEMRDTLIQKGSGKHPGLLDEQSVFSCFVMNTIQRYPQDGILSPLIWSMVADQLQAEIANIRI